ncbi:hypothetical protein Ahy_A02g007369 [Arachis hypogaea]|uniref:Uncharacterized protein n=1 Tax=Arachis hypogaea TaxID=3818 RepID=A0A445BBU3_ARAHY|nr:hypothetical protein Ahy_A10g051161 [Arachis hypogaea]RYR73073.1 hypothetical protein Ahy_A02g007369 [Arachis hypogaea]
MLHSPLPSRRAAKGKEGVEVAGGGTRRVKPLLLPPCLSSKTAASAATSVAELVINKFADFPSPVFLHVAESVFSKLKEGRFPGEIELKNLITKKMANSRLTDGVPELWP